MRFLKIPGSLKISVGLLAYLFGLTLMGTLAQAQLSNFQAQEIYFKAWWLWVGPVPLPAGLTIFLALAINLACSALRYFQLQLRDLGLWVIHAGLVLMACAGLVSGLGQTELVVGLWEGATADAAFPRSGGSQPQPLPFRLTLEKFQMTTYPESSLAKSYASQVSVLSGNARTQAVIAMNQPLRIQDFSIYQSSFETRPDGKVASILLLVRNPWSVLPYVFAGIIVGGFVLHLVVRRRRQEAA